MVTDILSGKHIQWREKQKTSKLFRFLSLLFYRGKILLSNSLILISFALFKKYAILRVTDLFS